MAKKSSKSNKKLIEKFCSICGKASHTKMNCPKVKKAKKINNISSFQYIDLDYINNESTQEESSQEKSDQKNSEIESRETNCFNIKKKWDF